MPAWLTATVRERHQWNSRLCSLKLELDLPEFEAGQFVNLGISQQGRIYSRPYSMVSPPGAELLEIYFNLVEHGTLSRHLFQLQPGDTVQSSPRAGGFFTLSQVPAAQQLWLCATGTALSPFLSILQTVDPWESFEHIILLHGVRDHSEITYTDQLAAIKQRHPQQFSYFHSVTREPQTSHFKRRIPDLFLSDAVEDLLNLTLTANNAQVMLCGNKGMVNETQAVLETRGLKKNQRRDPGQITVEIYQ